MAREFVATAYERATQVISANFRKSLTRRRGVRGEEKNLRVLRVSAWITFRWCRTHLGGPPGSAYATPRQV